MYHRTHQGPVARLAGLAPLAQCSTLQLSKIDHLCTEVRVAHGRVLCEQRQIGRECFIIEDGTARVTIDGQTVATLGRGEMIGELALLVPGERRIATVITETEMALLVLSRAEFATIMSAYPRVAHVVLREASRRMIENATARTC